jgi:hypothetical protein
MMSAAMAAPPAPPAARFKTPLMPLVAGTYGGQCMAIGSAGIGPGVPVVVDRLGRISAGPRSDDVVHTPAELTLEVQRKTSLVNFAAQVFTPDGGNGNGYNVAYGNGTPEVTAMASGGKVEATNQCQGGPVPAALKADLWHLAAQFVKVDEKNALCVDLREAEPRKGRVLFSETTFTIGATTLLANAPRDVELATASDASTGGFSYAVTDPRGNIAHIMIGADGRFIGATLRRADGSSLSCGPQPC